MHLFKKKNKIEKSLTNQVFGRNIVHMHVCDSTNEAAKRQSDMPHGTLFIADMQTNGKGRSGKSWESEKNCGIYMSLLLKPEMSTVDVSQITLVAAVAICRALEANTQIKWPNDIVIGTKKVCGILTEKTGDAVICGIGINVNTRAFPEEIWNIATSLYIETGKKHNRDYICAKVMNEFEELYDIFRTQGFGAIRDEYASLCTTLDKEVRLIRNNEEITAYAYGISENGELLIETEEGQFFVRSGEVSVRGIYGYV